MSTPHTLSTKDAVKGINMFKTVDVKILGLVQNMALFQCPHCNHDTAVFGASKRIDKVCADHDIQKLGDIPLHPNIGDDADRGKPTVIAEPDSSRSKAFTDIARAIGAQVNLKGLV